MLLRGALAILVLAGLNACVTETTETHTVPGAGRDAHGCIPSAGYAWCAKTRSCERVWELAEREGIDNSLAAFENYCGK